MDDQVPSAGRSTGTVAPVLGSANELPSASSSRLDQVQGFGMTPGGILMGSSRIIGFGSMC